MGSQPNKSWGINPADAPPSFDDGFTPPPAPPALGTNLALNRTATADSSCSAAESPSKAVDGILMNDSKWCSQGSIKWLQVDLGSSYAVSSFVIKHAGLGGESTGGNTGAFNIQLSANGSTWSTPVVTVAGNLSSRTYHAIVPTTARHVKLNITTPANDGSGMARIYEFEVYGTAAGQGGYIFLPMISR